MANELEKSLADKLGFSPGDSVFVETTPGWYTEFADNNGIELEPSLPATHVHIFCSSREELTDFLHDYDLKLIEKSFWVSWPKKDGSLKSDISDTDIRSIVLPLGWVDTKVISVDEDWSGLKFLRRKA